MLFSETFPSPLSSWLLFLPRTSFFKGFCHRTEPWFRLYLVRSNWFLCEIKWAKHTGTYLAWSPQEDLMLTMTQVDIYITLVIVGNIVRRFGGAHLTCKRFLLSSLKMEVKLQYRSLCRDGVVRNKQNYIIGFRDPDMSTWASVWYL